MKLGMYERTASVPPGAGTFTPLTIPHRIRTQKKGDGGPSWVKLQHCFTDVLYGKTLKPTEKVFAMMLYDQLFRFSNKQPGQPDCVLSTEIPWSDHRVFPGPIIGFSLV